MEYTPAPRSRLADYLVIGSFVLAVCAFCIASYMTAYGGFVQIAGLGFLTAAVYLAVRYRLTSFRYVLSEESDGVLFTVYRLQGRRSVAECRMSGVYLESVGRYTSKKALAEVRQGVSIYDYTVTLSPKDVRFLVFDSGLEKKTGVIIETDGRFYDALVSLAENNAACVPGRGDEE